ncbi:MAG: anion permease, partial [Candidatus Marinimicrobia bacterium]|nr:anion permease [Candidatus Neomarinimicrobiota bacterium]
MQNNKIVNSIIFWLSQKRWLIIAIIVGALFYMMPTPEGLTPEGHHILVIVVIAIFLIIFEPVPLP